MPEKNAFENNQISNFEGLVTLTLTLDRAILHTFVHHSSTSTYTPNFIQIEETDESTHRRIFETGFIRLTLSKSGLKKGHVTPTTPIGS